mgnify:CR=1 FL=1
MKALGKIKQSLAVVKREELDSTVKNNIDALETIVNYAMESTNQNGIVILIT